MPPLPFPQKCLKFLFLLHYAKPILDLAFVTAHHSMARTKPKVSCRTGKPLKKGIFGIINFPVKDFIAPVLDLIAAAARNMDCFRMQTFVRGVSSSYKSQRSS